MLLLLTHLASAAAMRGEAHLAANGETTASASNEDGPQTNPFATRHVRPGAIPYFFPKGVSIGELVSRLAENGWRGEIVGPHGTGKSTLVAALVEAIERRGRSVVVYRLRDGDRRLPMIPRNVRSLTAGELVVVDGYEQLPRWRQWMLRALCRRRGLGLLVTTHAATGLPLLWTTSADLTTVQRVVEHLLAAKVDRGASISKDDVAAALAAHPTNVREALFALYDVYEQRRKAAT